MLNRQPEAHANAVAITVDVEWARAEVLADLVGLLEERGLRATFFCTHPGVKVPGHERALHPNFRRNGDIVRQWRDRADAAGVEPADGEVYRHVVDITKTFCPEAVGVRSHSLFYDSELLPLYREVGLEYDSSYFLPLQPRLAPIRKECGILELPIYFMDHFDIIEGVSGFRVEGLGLDRPGLKVFDFHPNLVYLNAATNEEYLRSKPAYHDPVALRKMRNPGRGTRSLFVELLDALAPLRIPTATLREVNQAWRTFGTPGNRSPGEEAPHGA